MRRRALAAIGSLALLVPSWAHPAPIAVPPVKAIDYARLPVFEEPGAHVLVNPGGFTAAPSARDVARVYPKAAQPQRLNGRASIQCRVTKDGRLTNCAAAAETPSGLGFGEAALSLAPLIRMHPATWDGAPVGGYAVVVPIIFNAFPDQPLPQALPEVRRYAPLGSDLPPPAELDNLMPPQGRLSVLGVTAKGTIMSFLSLDDQVRHDDVTEVTLVSVAKVPLAWRGALLVAREKINCSNRTSELKARRDFDEAGRTIGWTWLDYTSAVPARADTDIGQAILAVCQGEPANAVVQGADEAKMAARMWPDRR